MIGYTVRSSTHCVTHRHAHLSHTWMYVQHTYTQHMRQTTGEDGVILWTDLCSIHREVYLINIQPLSHLRHVTKPLQFKNNTNLINI